MFQSPKNIDALLGEAEEAHLYFKLIEQTNKDFALANEAVDVPMDVFPIEFKRMICEKILKLIEFKFESYLNLLYIIDVSEAEIKRLNEPNLELLAEQVSFLVMKREWQKVWFKKYY